MAKWLNRQRNGPAQNMRFYGATFWQIVGMPGQKLRWMATNSPSPTDPAPAFATAHSCGAWRSLVAHLVWDQGVAGSNPVAPTRITQKDSSTAGVLFFCPSFSPSPLSASFRASLQAPFPAASLSLRPHCHPPHRRAHLPLFPLLQGTSRLSSKQSLFRPVAPPMLLGTTRNRRFGICVLT